MRKQQGFTLIELIWVLIIPTLIMFWVWNVFKFTSCDFEPNYQCEAIHGVGIIFPPLSYMTVWFSNDEI